MSKHGGQRMKRGNLVVMVTMLFILSLVVYARLPQQNPSQQPSAQGDQDRIEAAHGKLLSGEDKAKEASRLTEAVAPALPAAAASTAPVPRKNFVDEFIFGKMERDKIPHAPLASDEEFFRRVHMDLTGRIADPADLQKFMESRDPDKRDKLVDALVQSDAYVAKWTYWFGDLSETAHNRVGRDGANLY